MKLSTASKILAVVLGSAIAVAFVMSAVAVPTTSAAGYVFTRSLTVGSTGTDVMELQKFLNSNPATVIAATGAGSPGMESSYFGGLTRAAVSKFQAANGISPTAGYFGDKTRAVVNNLVGTASSGGSTVGGCAAGAAFSATTGAPCTGGTTLPAGCVVGAAFSSTTGAPCTGSVTVSGSVVTDGTDGQLTVSKSSYVASGVQLKKGDTKDVLALTLRATSGAVTITRAEVHFNLRPWLVFNQVTLKDSTGKVIATKALNSAADATEITVGSDYLVRFDNVNYTVNNGQQVDLVVGTTVLSATDKVTNNQVVNVVFGQNSLRTINGKGWTDSTGSADDLNGQASAVGITPQNAVGENYFTLSSTGSTAAAYTRISPSTPDTQTVNVSTANVTSDQVLGVFDIKVQNQPATLNGLTFNINNGAGVNSTVLFQNVRVYGPSGLIGGAATFSAANPGVVTFTNVNVPVAQDVWTSFVLKADVVATSSSFTASSTMVATGITGVDGNYNNIDVSNASNRTSNDTTFVPNGGIAITGITVTKGNPTFTQAGLWIAAYPAISFTIVNTGTNPIYVSKTAASAITFSASGVSASTTVATNEIASGSTTGDTSTSFIINGSRTFTYNFTADNTGGTTASRTLTLTHIKYGVAGVDASDHLLDINYGLTTATVQLP